MGVSKIPQIGKHTTSKENQQEKMLFFLQLAVIVFLFFVYNAKNEKPKNFPAGPRSFPIIGSLLSVGVDLKSAFQKWRCQWGDIVGFKMGSELAIVISDFDMLQEAFKDDRFAGRPENMQTVFRAFFERDSREKTTGGIVFSTGEHWKEQRRFAMRTLKEFGVGKTAPTWSTSSPRSASCTLVQTTAWSSPTGPEERTKNTQRPAANQVSTIVGPLFPTHTTVPF